MSELELCQRIRALEVLVDEIKEVLRSLETNHFPSLNKRIDELDVKMDLRFEKLKGSPSWAVLIIITFLSSLVIALITLIFKNV